MTNTNEFFQEGEEGRYTGGPADIAAQQEALAHLEREGEAQHPQSLLPPGVLDERRQKFTKIVIGVVLGSALLVVMAALLSSRAGSSSSEPESLDKPTNVQGPLSPEEPVQGEAVPAEEVIPVPEAPEEDEGAAVERREPPAAAVTPAPRAGASNEAAGTSRSPLSSSEQEPAPELFADEPSPTRTSSDTGSGSRAVERAKATRRPSDNPPSVGFPEP